MSVSIYVIAAICGNFWCEGGINSGIYESLKVTPDTAVYSHNTGGFGLGNGQTRAEILMVDATS